MKKNEFIWNDTVSKCFDELAEEWNAKSGWLSMISDGESERLMKLIPHIVKEKDIVADIGCGTGKVTRNLLKIPRTKVYSVDSSIEMIRVLRKEIKSKRVTSLHSDIKLFKPSEKLDCIFLLQVLHHLYSPFEVLSHLEEVLSTEGKIVVLVPGERHLQELFEFKENNDLLGRYSVNSLCHLAHKCNLLVDRVYDDDFKMTFETEKDLTNFVNSTSLGYKVNNYEYPILKKDLDCDQRILTLQGNYITVVLKKNEASNYIARTQSAYEQWSPEYSQVVLRKISDRGYSYDDLASLVCSNLVLSGKNVLEVGMGTGLIGQRVKKLVPDCFLTGIDVSEHMIKQCNQSEVYDKIFINDVISFSSDMRFSVIYSTFMVHHLYALYDGLRSITKFLDGGGIIRIVDLVLPSETISATDLLHHCNEHEYSAGVNYYTVDEMLNLLKLLGLKDVCYSSIGEKRGYAHYIFEGQKKFE